MKAIRVHEFGEPEVMRLEDVPEPVPAGDEVLVRIRAAGVQPADTYIRSGVYGMLPSLPYTPGWDAAGVDVATGARVYVAAFADKTYAEYALCRPEELHPLPEGLTFAQGAAIGTPYPTAYRALFQRARAQSGESVLIHGASGAVGVALVQCARAAGLTVVGTAGSDGGRELLATQGAAAVVDHRDPEHLAAARAALGGRGFDIICELRADLNLGADLKALARRGRVVVIGSRGPVEIVPRDLMNVDGDIRAMLLPLAAPAEIAEAHRAIDKGLRDGSLRPVVGRELPLAEAPRAHHLILEQPALGKLVLIP